MSEMIERVARAIEKAFHEHADCHEGSLAIARAAIEAMREPTEAMVNAALAVDGLYEYPKGKMHWDCMINAALEDQRNASQQAPIAPMK